MKKSTTRIAILGSLLLATSCGLNDEKQQTSSLPGAETFLYELPSSVTAQGGASGLGRTLAAAEGENESLFDAYRPVPIYIGFAAALRDQVAGFIDGLPPLPDEFDHSEDGVTVSGSTIDSLDHKLFTITIDNDNTSEHLEMRYWKNARDQYMGDFLFQAANGDRAYLTFNNHNEALLGRRMNIIAYRAPENLEDPNAPSVVSLRTVKRDGKVFVAGASYHPTWQDSQDQFWYAGAQVPSLYAFAVAANADKDVAVLRAAFGPASEAGPGFLQEHSLDQVVIDQGAAALTRLMASNDTLRRFIWWSLNTETPITEANIAANVLPITATCATEACPEELTPEQLVAFSAINDDPAVKDDIGQWARFAKARQPIFLRAGALIAGNRESLTEAGVTEATFGIDEAQLEEPLFTEIEVDPASTVDLDPESWELESVPTAEVE